MYIIKNSVVAKASVTLTILKKTLHGIVWNKKDN